MSIDGNGEFELYKLKMSKERSYKETIKKVRNQLNGKEKYYMAYLYGNDISILDGIKADISDLEERAIRDYEAKTGSVVAVHVGPKIYAVAYLIVE